MDVSHCDITGSADRPAVRECAAAGPGLGQRVVRALAVVLLLSLVAISPVGAQGPSDCSAPVVDTSGLVDVAQVEAAAAAIDPEVTVVVRSFGSVPDQNLVSVIDEIVASCFGNEDFGLRADVIVLGLSVDDRLSDVLIGAEWGAAIPDPEQLRTGTLGPRFAEGDYTGGLVAALNEIDEAVDDFLGTDGTATTTETPVPAPEVGGQSPWAVGGGLAGIAGCGGVFVLVSRHRKLVAARAEYERSSAGPIARLRVLRERAARLNAQAEIWSKTTAGRTTVKLREMMQAADRGRAGADRASGLLSGTLPGGAAGADRATIKRAQEMVMELSRALDGLDEALDRLAAFGAHIDHLVVALPAKAQLLDEEVDEALELAAQRESEGWAVETPRGEIKGVAASIDSLDFDRFELDLLALSDQIETAEAQLFASAHYVQSLPSRVKSLKQWNAGLEAAADLEVRRIEDLRRQFVLLAGVHASDSWQWAADYPEQALEELQRADELQDVAISQLISSQQFDEAGRQLDAAGVQLMAADSLLDQVDDLVVDLERAMDESPRIVAQCSEVLSDLTAFIGRHGGDLDPDLLARPAELAQVIEGLRRELQQNKPNYLRVAETGDRMNRQMDQLLIEAKDQHLRMEVLRRQVQREVDRARRSLSRARRSLGWELFKSRDGAALDGLEATLLRLPEDLERAAELAGDVADDALRIQERIIARRRRSSVWVNTGGGSWNIGGGGWSSGGGSSSSGRSFGGSRSASGGRSFGGGRSSGGF